jgi:hypothetical protein
MRVSLVSFAFSAAVAGALVAAARRHLRAPRTSPRAVKR